MVTGKEVEHKHSRGRKPVEVWAPLIKKPGPSKMVLSETITSALENSRTLVDLALEARGLMHIGIDVKKGVEAIMDKRSK